MLPTICGSLSLTHSHPQDENANVWDFKLTDDEVAQITKHGASKNLRMCNPPFKYGKPMFD